MIERAKKIWADGEFVEWDDANVHLTAYTMHYGLGAFEGIRAYKRAGGETAIFRLKEHIQRLFNSCRLIMVEPDFTIDQLEKACEQLLIENEMDEAYLRPLIYVGDGAMGIYAPNNPVRAAVIAWRWGSYLGEDALANGIRVKISPWARHHINVSFAKGKIVGQYTNSALAKRDAKMSGFDEAILMDAQGYVSEGSGENLFIVKNGTVITPPLSASILEGITRDTVMTLAREEGLVVEEQMLTRDQLYLADEAFFTGTAAEVTPIREVDFRRIGNGKVGAVSKLLQARYFDVVRGSDNTHPEWLASV